MATGTYDTPQGMALSLAAVKDLMSAAGARKLFAKHLAPNDNSKNQPYLGPDLTTLNIIPTGQTVSEPTKSHKTGATGTKIFRFSVQLSWLAPTGQLLDAPNSKIIHYPQYPETRFSGFLKGSDVELGEWMNPDKQGRNPNRFLIFGVTDTRRVLAYLAVDGSVASHEMQTFESTAKRAGVFFEIPLQEVQDTRMALLMKLKEIAELGWVDSVRLSANGLTPCNSPNCGGYTLEALLGISPNGFAEPDYLGWEVKQFGVKNFSKLNSSIITLMTPEPDGGVYCTDGVDKFVRAYGYADLKGREDRLNFGGVHRHGTKVARTGLTLYLKGYDTSTQKIVDADGGIVLLDDFGVIAAQWGFTKLIDHWKRKHNQAVYVPSIAEIGASRRYRYGASVKLCSGTDFLHVLKALLESSIYYDPGIKIENASTNPVSKRRSQFRIKSKDVNALYNNVEVVDLNCLL